MTPVLLLSALLTGPALIGTAAADTGTDCSEWGAVTPDERSTYFGEFVTFRIAGGWTCGNVDTCSWWSDSDYGDFLQTTGSPVTWRAPATSDDCVTLEFRLWASCTEGNTTGYSDVTVRCTHEQLEGVQASRNAVVTGGGCNGPTPTTSTAAAGLLLVPLLGLRRRRRG